MVRPPYITIARLTFRNLTISLIEKQLALPVADTATCVENDVSYQTATNLVPLH